MDTLIQIIGANASYLTRKVLRGVDLTLHRGEIVGLIGVNGAGKSTLVDVIVGRHALAEGRMVLADEPYAPSSIEESQACGIGVISQNSEPPEGMTVAQALFRFTYRADEPYEAIRDRASELLQEAGIDIDCDTMVAELGRGRRALVEIARMLAEEAQLVVVDEIAVTLADHEIAILHRVLRQLAAQGRGILYITHRMDEIQSIAHRVLVLRDGVVEIDRSTDGLSVDDLATLLLGENSDSSAAELNRVASDDVDAAIAAVAVADGDRLHGVDFHVNPGEVVGVTGTYDSGVRELMEIFGGHRVPRDGHLELRGERTVFSSSKEAEEKGVSYLSDLVPTEFPLQRLIEGIAGDDHALDAEIRRARRMIGLIRELRINTTNIDTALEQLSGGDQQKAELIRTVEKGGDVLVLAHPTRGIDVGARKAVFAFLHDLASRGVAIVFLSTDMSELLEWSHRVAVLANGRLVLQGHSDNLDEDALVHAMLGAPVTEHLGRRASAAPRELTL